MKGIDGYNGGESVKHGQRAGEEESTCLAPVFVERVVRYATDAARAEGIAIYW